MMTLNPSRLILWGGWLLVMAAFGWSTWQQEHLLANGEVVRLELAPRDPRSIMQGDYMALNYALANTLRFQNQQEDGYAMVTLSPQRVATLVRTQAEPEPRQPGEYALRYRLRDRQLRFATNAFFFQEGTAAIYEAARYGEFRVDGRGNLLLTHMLDDKLQALGAFKR